MGFTSVAVPQDNSRVWQTPSNRILYGGSVNLTTECRDWLEGEVGIRDFSHFGVEVEVPPHPCWQIRNSYHMISKNGPTKIYFSRARDAMLFKLTWL